MVRVAARGSLSVYVYANEVGMHRLPHCHVYWENRAESAVLALPSLRRLAGKAPPADVIGLVEQHFQAICDTWDQLNPTRTVG
jgi:hypothetical protein